MADFISPETFSHLVKLAALELNEEEAEYLRGELNNQLKAIWEMEAIPLDLRTRPTIHGVSYPDEVRPPIREDLWTPYYDPDGIIDQSPQQDQGFVLVPDTPPKELE